MPVIRCPRCRARSRCDLRGRWMVRCELCGYAFQVVVLGRYDDGARDVTCPSCGHTEQVRVEPKLVATCPECGHVFAVSW
ncbi:MAG: hypothetical protein AB1445_12460 [Bacillota bacterium]